MKTCYFALIFLTVLVILSFSIWGFMFILYPQKYEKEVLIYAKTFNISPSLVFAIIKTESGFNPNAISSAGAMGLMQIMPQTAKPAK